MRKRTKRLKLGKIFHLKPIATAATAIVILGACLVFASPKAAFIREAKASFVNVTTKPATSVTDTSAQLNGYMETDIFENLETSFLWGEYSGDYTEETPAVPAQGISPEDFNYLIKTLTPGKTYYFKAKVKDTLMMEEYPADNEESFTTLGGEAAVPEFTTITLIIAAVAGFGIYFLIKRRKEKAAPK